MHSTLRTRGWRIDRLAVAAFIIVALLYATVTKIQLIGRLDGHAERFLSSLRSDKSRHVELADEVSWGNFAYSTYATAPDHLCNSVMLLESLHRLNAKADRLLLYSNEWEIDSDGSKEAKLLRQARDKYGVKIKPIELVTAAAQDPTWAAGFTKWLAFNQTQYKRVLTLDSDATILRSMDELFLMPATPVAMPRAYWLNDTLSAQLVLVQPSIVNFAAIQKQMEVRELDDYDMEIINGVFGGSCAVLPHRPYNLLTGEFRALEHTAYLGSSSEPWDAESVVQEAKYIHFSDWPLPKPWETHQKHTIEDVKPKCGGKDDCAERRVWKRLYEDFRERRHSVCGPDYVNWEPGEAKLEVQRLLGGADPS